MLGLGLGVDKIRPVTAGGLLDLYPATAAYSLRALSSSTTNVVRVREDGSNTEQDFTAKEITDGTLASFCGANNGFVVTWYDQAGNNNATQATAGSQPKIYDSITGVVLENGKAALDFDGIDDYLSANTLASSFSGEDLPISRFAIIKPNQLGSYYYLGFGNSANDNSLKSLALRAEGNFLALYRDDANTTKSTIDGSYSANRFLITETNSGTATSVYKDGTTVFTNLDIDLGQITLNKATIAVLERSSFIGYFNGNIQEIIVYSSDQSANRTAIESNINSHYNIYS